METTGIEYGAAGIPVPGQPDRLPRNGLSGYPGRDCQDDIEGTPGLDATAGISSGFSSLALEQVGGGSAVLPGSALGLNILA